MKNIKGKNKTRQLLSSAFMVMIVVFSLLIAFQDFLHFHPLDNGEHQNCTVYRFKQAIHFCSLLWFGLFYVMLVAVGRYFPVKESAVQQITLTNNSSRAPPFFS